MWLPEVRACRGPEPARGFACGGEEAGAVSTLCRGCPGAPTGGCVGLPRRRGNDLLVPAACPPVPEAGPVTGG